MKIAKPKEEFTYEVRDVVLAKIRGYPSWPAMVRRVLLHSWSPTPDYFRVFGA